jgi:hypothetical protein
MYSYRGKREEPIPTTSKSMAISPYSCFMVQCFFFVAAPTAKSTFYLNVAFAFKNAEKQK